MNEPNRQETAAILATHAAALRGLVVYFQAAGVNAAMAKRHECTIEAFRYLKKVAATSLGEMTKLQVGLGHGMTVPDQPVPETVVLTTYVETLLECLNCLMEPFKLTELPAGRPGTPEFEEAYGQKIPLSKPFNTLTDYFKLLIAALENPQYKIEVNDEVREAAWRAEKKRQIEVFIDECKAQIEQAQGIAKRCTASLKQARDDLKNIDQLPLFHEPAPYSDAAEAAESSPDSSPAAPSSGEQNSDAAGSQ